MRRGSVVVVGAGVFGAWSALRLARDGWRVTLVDAYGPANGRASSADHSRVVRAGYGADEIYTRWATEALTSWHWLAKTTGQRLVEECGVLFLGERGSSHLEETAATFRSLGVAHHRLAAAEVAARYPQLGVIGLGDALFEPRAGAIRARQAVAATVAVARARGVVCRTARVRPLDETATAPVVVTADGERLHADHYVLAGGPWLPGLLPLAVGGRIRPTRQDVLYFGVPAGDARFGVERLPAWIDFAAGVYGIPDLDAHGFKIGLDRHGPAIDPDTADRVVSGEAIATARAFLARRFPALAAAPVVGGRVCQYENTASGDFLIDVHPTWANVWIVGGGSGHGFKHGPSVGGHVADLVGGRAAVAPRFALAGKSSHPARAVY
ncbi:MAG: FAD-dependent oxidoreductase [Vicinamibacterales bacterium]